MRKVGNGRKNIMNNECTNCDKKGCLNMKIVHCMSGFKDVYLAIIDYRHRVMVEENAFIFSFEDQIETIAVDYNIPAKRIKEFFKKLYESNGPCISPVGASGL
jgi:hypothetical protein